MQFEIPLFPLLVILKYHVYKKAVAPNGIFYANYQQHSCMREKLAVLTVCFTSGYVCTRSVHSAEFSCWVQLRRTSF